MGLGIHHTDLTVLTANRLATRLSETKAMINRRPEFSHLNAGLDSARLACSGLNSIPIGRLFTLLPCLPQDPEMARRWPRMSLELRATRTL